MAREGGPPGDRLARAREAASVSASLRREPDEAPVEKEMAEGELVSAGGTGSDGDGEEVQTVRRRWRWNERRRARGRVMWGRVRSKWGCGERGRAGVRKAGAAMAGGRMAGTERWCRVEGKVVKWIREWMHGGRSPRGIKTQQDPSGDMEQVSVVDAC